MLNRDIKIAITGDVNVGKSYLVSQYTHHPYDNLPTQIAAYHRYQLKEENITLGIWDLSGDANYVKFLEQYYTDKDVYIIVFDLTNKESYDHVKSYFEQIVNNSIDPKIVLVANKSDLDAVVTEEDIAELEKDLQTKCIRVSAECEINVNEVFQKAINLCQHENKNKDDSFFSRHSAKILLGGMILGVIVTLGVLSFGVVPAIAAGIMALGVASALGAGLLGIGAIGLSGFLTGLFATALMCLGIDYYHRHHPNPSPTPKPPSTNTRGIFERIGGGFRKQKNQDEEMTFSTTQSKEPFNRRTPTLAPTTTPPASINTLLP
jgi:small GTP-binding protein